MQAAIIELVEQYGYAAVALLILIENVFPPIPSEIVLAFGGFLTVQTQMSPWLVIVFATVGSVAGAAVLYLVGWLIPKQRLEQLFAGKTGRVLRLKAEDVGRAEHWFRRYEQRAVLFCRCVPVVRQPDFDPGRNGAHGAAAVFSVDRSRQRGVEYGVGLVRNAGRRCMGIQCACLQPLRGGCAGCRSRCCVADCSEKEKIENAFR